jgi:hypothetical protein
MARKTIVEQTLEWVNGVRKERGLRRISRLKKGLRGSSTRCPIARSLGSGASVGTKAYYLPGMGWDARVPEFVQRFVRNFDYKRYPEFETKRAPKLRDVK